jgi:type II secretory pathway component PulF
MNKKVSQIKKMILKSSRSAKKQMTSSMTSIRGLGGKADMMAFGKLSIKDQIFFAKRLSFLIKAGIPLLDSLIMIREQTRSKRQGLVLDDVIESVSSGQSLATSLTKYKRVFGDFAIQMIHVGESTGILSDNLEYLAQELQKNQTLRRKVVSAFIYPAVVTVATFGITVFLMVYLFPKIMPVFQSLNMKLPLSTRIVIFGSNTLRHYGIYVFLALILLAVGTVYLFKKFPNARKNFDALILKLPIVGSIIQLYNLANITRTLGLLLKSGIAISEAVPITSKVTSHSVYKNSLLSLVEIVDSGEQISAHFKKNRGLYPDVIHQIISVGERSGNLPNSLIYLSDMYEKDVEEMTKNLSGLIEPILMIVMGVLVGFIAISIITPIYGITQNLH